MTNEEIEKELMNKDKDFLVREVLFQSDRATELLKMIGKADSIIMSAYRHIREDYLPPFEPKHKMLEMIEEYFKKHEEQ